MEETARLGFARQVGNVSVFFDGRGRHRLRFEYANRRSPTGNRPGVGFFLWRRDECRSKSHNRASRSTRWIPFDAKVVIVIGTARGNG
jgi:hypothetical protein